MELSHKVSNVTVKDHISVSILIRVLLTFLYTWDLLVIGFEIWRHTYCGSHILRQFRTRYHFWTYCECHLLRQSGVEEGLISHLMTWVMLFSSPLVSCLCFCCYNEKWTELGMSLRIQVGLLKTSLDCRVWVLWADGNAVFRLQCLCQPAWLFDTGW